MTAPMCESRLFGVVGQSDPLPYSELAGERWEVQYYGSGVAVAFVPAAHVTPFALL
jgi:hypothetical protein